MDQNPYAAPQARAELGASFGGGEPQPWDIGEVLSQAWDGFAANWGVVLGTLLLTIVGGYVLEGVLVFVGLPLAGLHLTRIGPGVGLPPGFWAFYFAAMVALYLFEAFVMVGLTRVWIGVARNEKPTLATFLSGAGRYLTMILTMLLVTLGVYVGLFFLVIPGLVLALGWMLSAYFVADTGLGVLGVMKASWAASRGQKVSLLLFGVVLVLLNLVGLLACGLGVLVSGPVSGIALAIVYTRVTGRTASASAEGSIPGLTTP